MMAELANAELRKEGLPDSMGGSVPPGSRTPWRPSRPTVVNRVEDLLASEMPLARERASGLEFAERRSS